MFVQYNNAIWPVQPVAYLLGWVAVACLFSRTPDKHDRVISGGLGAMWLWTGIVYHGLFFSPINSAAYLFAGLFIAQGIYLIYAGVFHHQIRFGIRAGIAASVGAAFALLCNHCLSLDRQRNWPPLS